MVIYELPKVPYTSAQSSTYQVWMYAPGTCDASGVFCYCCTVLPLSSYSPAAYALCVLCSTSIGRCVRVLVSYIRTSESARAGLGGLARTSEVRVGPLLATTARADMSIKTSYVCMSSEEACRHHGTSSTRRDVISRSYWCLVTSDSPSRYSSALRTVLRGGA